MKISKKININILSVVELFQNNYLYFYISKLYVKKTEKIKNLF